MPGLLGIPRRRSIIGFAGIPWLRPFCVLLGPTNTSSSTRSARLLILGREHKHVLPRTGPELDHVLVSQLQVPTIRDLVAVELGTIRALQVDQIRLHTADLIPVLVPLLRIAELDDGMLLANARVLGWQVGNGQIPPDEPAAARVQFNGVDDLVALEDVQPPLVARGGLAGLGWLVVFECDSGSVGLRNRVGLGGEHACVAKVRLLLGFLGFLASADSKGVTLRG